MNPQPGRQAPFASICFYIDRVARRDRDHRDSRSHAVAGLEPREGEGQAAACMSNNKQLILAWTMYVHDNADRLPINSLNSQSYQNTPSWIFGWMDWSIGQQNTNLDYLVNHTFSLLGQNVGKSIKIFACPAANYVSRPEQALGWTPAPAASPWMPPSGMAISFRVIHSAAPTGGPKR